MHSYRIRKTSSMQGRKEIIITGRKVVKWVCVLTIVVVIVFAGIMGVRGTPVVELLTEYWMIWVGLLVAILGLYFSNRGKSKEQQ